MKSLIVVLLSSLLLAGCATHNFQRYATIDRSNKTITVAPGSGGLNGQLKQALAKNGWKLYVYEGAEVTEGEIGKKTKIMRYDTFNSRYRLVVSSNQFDWCVYLTEITPAITYDISFIDNRSGAEVFTLSGRDCESDVAERFTHILQGKE